MTIQKLKVTYHSIIQINQCILNMIFMYVNQHSQHYK